MILGYLLPCAGGCGLQIMVSRNVAHWCDACLERASDSVGEDYLPLEEVQG